MFEREWLLAEFDSPIRTRFFSLEETFPPQFLRRVLETLKWENRDQWTISPNYFTGDRYRLTGARSLTTPLDDGEKEELSHIDDRIVAAQFKGSLCAGTHLQGQGLSIDDNIDLPSSELFTDHSNKSVSIGSGGRFVADGFMKSFPRGPLTHNQLVTTVTQLQAARSNGISGPYPLGYAIFPDVLFEGKPTGFVLLGVYNQWNARCMHHFALVNYIDPAVNDGYSGPHPIILDRFGYNPREFPDPERQRVMLENINENVSQHFTDLFVAYGQALRQAHKRGIVFHNPHIDNVSFEGGILTIHDWGAAQNVYNKPKSERSGLFALDIHNLSNQLITHLQNSSMLRLEPLTGYAQMQNPFTKILLGYGFASKDAQHYGGFIYHKCQHGSNCADADFFVSLRKTITDLR